MISLFISDKDHDADTMLTNNGDVILKHVVSAEAKFSRNAIIYLTIEFAKEDLLGYTLSNESVFKVDLSYADGQLFRMIYYKYKKSSNTYTCYASQIFFDVQKEVPCFDDRTVTSTWDGAIKTANDLITNASTNYPYSVVGSGSDETATAYWQKYNLIQCLFGSEDNSLMNRWTQCDELRYVAMMDNFTCYFGDGSNYPSDLKPKEIVIATTKEVSDYTRKVSMEDVVTGIIPQSYNGHMLPNQEIVKSDLWDTYKIRRIEYRSYEKVKLKADVSSSSDSDSDNDDIICDTETTLYATLREKAQADLKTEAYPTTETDIDIVDIFGEDSPYTSNLKINDILYLTADEQTGARDKYYISELTYNCITKKAKSLKLILESEEE